MNNPNQSYFDKYFDPVVRDIDRVNIYEFENGMDYELTQSGKEINLDSIKSAQAKVLKNLKKDPAYYTNMLAAESVKMFGEYGTGKGRVAKSTTAKEAESIKKDGKAPKVNKQDSPFGVKNELKGKYKSSGMEPTKKSLKEAYDLDNASTETDPAGYSHGRLMPEEDEKAKEKSAYDKKREEDEKAKEMARNAMKKSLGLKKEDVNVGDSRKIRLTPTTKNQIFTLVHEAVKSLKEESEEVKTLNTQLAAKEIELANILQNKANALKKPGTQGV